MPLPGKLRQAQFVLPNVTDWKGLKLSAEIEVKGMRYPVRSRAGMQRMPSALMTRARAGKITQCFKRVLRSLLLSDRNRANDQNTG